MDWVTPQYSREVINKAGRILVSETATPEAVAEALDIIGNWRSSHSFPLNTFKLYLLSKASYVDERSLVAQRLKRLSSISDKLRRYPDMKISKMQDIAGCRAIVTSVKHVRELVDIYKNSDIKHKLVHEDDYIHNPKDSGYRCAHLVYRYYSDKKQTYNGLKVEVQIRSVLQHAWATAVETVGTFIQQALKSSQGEERWLRFFALMGSAIAYKERTPPVPGTPVDIDELRAEIIQCAIELDVQNRLQAYGQALHVLEEADVQRAKYYLLELDPTAKTVKVTGYSGWELEKASDDYLTVERRVAGTSGDAVLVSVESLAALRRAYPNYFLDTDVFIREVKRAMTPPAVQRTFAF